MKQYTLLYIDTNTKVVHNMAFLDMQSLQEFKRGVNALKDLELKPVDRDGYVWVIESDEE